MSPWVATTRFSLVATMTLHPVPQNRHGALSHFSSLSDRSVTRFAACAGAAIPPAIAAMAAACSLRTWRRSGFSADMTFLPRLLARIDGVKDQRRRIDVGQQRDLIERRADGTGIGNIDHHDELAFGIAAVNFASVQRQDRGLDTGQALGTGLDQNTGDLAARGRDDAGRIEQTALEQGATIDGR